MAALPSYSSNESFKAIQEYLHGPSEESEPEEEALVEAVEADPQPDVIPPRPPSDQEGGDPLPSRDDEDQPPDKSNPRSLQWYISKQVKDIQRREEENNELDDDHDVANALEWIAHYVFPQDIIFNNEDNAMNGQAMLSYINLENFEDNLGRVLDEDKANEVVNSMQQAYMKLIHQILTSHVHCDYRAKKHTTSIKKDLALWLQKPNSFRSYFFYKVVGLKALMEKRRLSFVEGEQSSAISKEERMGALAGTLPEGRINTIPEVQEEETVANPSAEVRNTQDTDLSTQDLIIKQILTKSFLPHQKGGFAIVEIMVIG